MRFPSRIPTVLPLSELVCPVVKQTVKLLRFFINVSPHLKTSQSLQVWKNNNYEIFCCYPVHPSSNLMSEWRLGQSKMRPDWHAAPEGKGRICGGRIVSAGTAIWLRAPSLIKLQCATCVSFDKFGKSCHFLTGAWPHGGWNYQNASVSRSVHSLRLDKRGRDSDLIIPIVEQQPETETLSQDDLRWREADKRRYRE